MAANAFAPLPLGSIEPAGWLANQLQVQARGLGGHVDEVWPDVGPNSGWLGGTGESWERGPYFLDGLVPLAWQLRDPMLRTKAQRYLDWTLDHAQKSGFFGPAANDDWWPRMVMLKVLTQYQEASGDDRVIPVMERYFAYSLREMPNRPLRDWGRYRWQDEVLSVLWLYNRTGDPSLLQLAQLLARQGYDWRTQFADFHYTERCTPAYLGLEPGRMLTDRGMQTHGVNNAMALKVHPVYYLLDGVSADKSGLLRQLALLDQYHGLPNGMFSADEHFAGRNPSQGIELCAVVEAMFSLEQALAITGDSELGDRLERIAFNALPGAFTDDMWAHQYNQEPNQVEVSLHREPWTTDGPESNIYGLAPNFGCCTANFHQGWPKFTASLWMQSADRGLAALAYGPCRVHTRIGSTDVSLTVQTAYPFSGNIQIRSEPAAPLTCPISLRIPGWVEGARVRVNGENQEGVKPGGFFRIQRTWKAGDVISLEFPMKPRTSRWFHDSIAVERGPLVFSHAIGGDWLKLVDRGQANDWQVYPTSEWNYALALDPDTVENAVTVCEADATEDVFTETHAPVRLTAPAVMVPDWRAQDGVAAPPPVSPLAEIPGADAKVIPLVPYAAAKLRITAFPQYPAGDPRQAEQQEPQRCETESEDEG
ncbi:MAG: beta-L-arabinofuranosidase domain-containing protein [Acidobacteriaceae bacterium]